MKKNFLKMIYRTDNYGYGMTVLLGFVFILSCFLSCQREASIGQYPISNDPPPPPIVVSVTNTNGGADITFKVPSKEDLLYVEARYEIIGGLERVTKVSSYENILKLSGIGDTLVHKVVLRSVDRSQNRSVPVETTFRPKTPVVVLVANTIKMTAVFGGIVIDWVNITGEAIVVIPSFKNADGKVVDLERVYSGASTGMKLIDKLDTTKREFFVKIMDRWDNISNPVSRLLKPKAEEVLVKKNITALNLSDDSQGAYGSSIASTIDGDQLSWWHTGAGNLPHKLSYDLGSVLRLSRININEGAYCWYWAAWKTLDIYGRIDRPVDGAGLDTWKKLKSNVTFPAPPSGMAPGSNANSGPDADWARKEGMMILFDPEKEDTQIRYLRIVFTSSYGSTDVSMGEINLWYTF